MHLQDAVSLRKITIKSTKLKKIGKNAFKGINKKAVIRIPKSKKKTYKKLLKGGVKTLSVLRIDKCIFTSYNLKIWKSVITRRKKSCSRMDFNELREMFLKFLRKRVIFV